MKHVRKLAAAFCAALASSALAAPQVVKTVHPTKDVVVAEEVMDPPVNPGTDVSQTLQKRLYAVGARGGGVLFLRAGTYTLAQPVFVPVGVTLRGDYDPAKPAESTVIAVTAGRGEEEGQAAVTLMPGSGVVGLVFHYPEQTLRSPAPYPWTVRTSRKPPCANDNQSVFDCTFVNSWQAISIGPEWNELHTFRRLAICGLQTGFAVDSTTDIGRVSEVEVSPAVWARSGFPNSPAEADVREYLRSHDAIGADYGRSDWEYVWRLRVKGYATGVRFRKGVRGLTNAVMADCDVSDCETALRLEQLNGVGLSVYNCRLGGRLSLDCAKEFRGSAVQFHTTSFRGALRIDGDSVATFQHCGGDSALDVVGAGQVVGQDCAFPSVSTVPATRRFYWLGFNAKQTKVANSIKWGDVRIDPRAKVPPPSPAVAPVPMEMPRPMGQTLFVVTDYGASRLSKDNAAAFQKAIDAAAPSRGTVYVPAGQWRFTGNFTVRAGVELRGVSDVPHHTVSGGSVLMPKHGANDENGTPFIQMEAGSGLRGLAVWYPEQPTKAPVPYPWTVRSLGPGCWIVDVNVANSWQGVDFATNPSAGHRVSYLSGAFWRRGLFVGSSSGRGWVEDVQFNPHYAVRVPKGMPMVELPAKGDIPPGRSVWSDNMRTRLEGIVFRNCADEQVRGTFLYAAFDGISFYGRNQVQALIHGTDTGAHGFVVEQEEGSRLEAALMQLVPYATPAQTRSAGVWLKKGDRGRTSLYNTQMWVDHPSVISEGGGRFFFEQVNSLSGMVLVEGGNVVAANVSMDRSRDVQAAVSAGAKGLFLGCADESGEYAVDFAEGAQGRALNCSRDYEVDPALCPKTPPVEALIDGVKTKPMENRIAPRGGRRQFADDSCVLQSDADGRPFIRLAGTSLDPSYSFIYYLVWDRPIPVWPRTRLVYKCRAANGQSLNCGIDLVFDDGTVMREHGGRTTCPAGKTGEWVEVTFPLNRHLGKTIVGVMLCYDSRNGGGPIQCDFSDIRFTNLKKRRAR